MKRAHQFQDDEVYPAAMSASGTNAHHVNGCPIVGQSQPYAACLKRISDYEAGGALESMTECRRAIGGPACTAWKMREDETKAGKALFYVNRSKLQAFNGTVIVTDRPEKAAASPATINDGPTSTYAVKNEPNHPTAYLGGSYADAINATMQTLSTPAPAQQNTDNKPAMNPGETAIEYVRRLKSMSV